MIWIGAKLFALPLLVRLGVYAATLLALWLGYAAWKQTIYHEGRTYERRKILAEIEENQAHEIELRQKAKADADVAVDRSGDDGVRLDPYNRDNARTDKGAKGKKH